MECYTYVIDIISSTNPFFKMGVIIWHYFPNFGILGFCYQTQYCFWRDCQYVFITMYSWYSLIASFIVIIRNNVINFFGKFVEPTETTTYPNEFSVIEDLEIAGNDLYIVSNKKLYKSNFLQVQDQYYEFTLEGIEFAYKLEQVFGFDGDITISQDGENYYPIDDNVANTVPDVSGSYLKIRITVSRDELMERNYTIQDGIVILSFI